MSEGGTVTNPSTDSFRLILQHANNATMHTPVHDGCLKLLVPETAIFARKTITFADPIAELSRGCFRPFITNVVHEVHFRSPSSKVAALQYESGTKSKLPLPGLNTKVLHELNFLSLESQTFQYESSTQSKLPQPQLESRNLSVPK